MHCYPGDSCAMYLAHVCSFKAELMLSVPFLLILARLLAEASGKDSIKESSPLDFSDSPHCAGGGWTSPCSHGFSQCEIPPCYHLLRRSEKVFVFGEKTVSTPPGYPGEENMGEGLPADCGEENMGFLTSFGSFWEYKLRSGQ